MANGWARLGEALAGITPAKRADIEAKTVGALAQRDSSVAKARMDMEKAKHFSQDSLGQYFIDIGSDDPVAVARAQAGVALSGVNYNGLQSGLADRQKMGFRQGAVDAAEAGDWGLANARLAGVAPGPFDVPKVSGGMLMSNRLIPGGGDVTVTPIGQSQIRANDARAQASIINANKPRAAGGGRSGAAPKLSEIEKMRLQAELKALEPQLQAALDEVARNQGATVGPGVRKLADAQARVAEIQAAQQAIFDKYEGGVAAPVEADTTPDEPDDGIPVVDSGRSLGDVMTSDIQYQAPGGGQRTLPPDPAALRQQADAIAQKFKADAQRAIANGADPAKVQARMRELILKEMGR